VAAGLRRAAGALADAGFVVEELEVPALDGVLDAWLTFTGADIAAHWELIEAVTSEPTRRMLATSLAAGDAPSLDGYRNALLARGAIGRAYAALFQRFPLILGPVSTRLPFEAGSDVDAPLPHVRSIRLTLLANLLGLPAVAVPTGIDAGLPQGVQLIGPRYAEHLCLAAAEAVEARLGTFTPTDPR
jgi:amidase